MRKHGWHLDMRDRLGTWSAPPEARRQAAAEGWAVDAGITEDNGGQLPTITDSRPSASSHPPPMPGRLDRASPGAGPEVNETSSR